MSSETRSHKVRWLAGWLLKPVSREQPLTLTYTEHFSGKSAGLPGPKPSLLVEAGDYNKIGPCSPSAPTHISSVLRPLSCTWIHHTGSQTEIHATSTIVPHATSYRPILGERHVALPHEPHKWSRRRTCPPGSPQIRYGLHLELRAHSIRHTACAPASASLHLRCLLPLMSF